MTYPTQFVTTPSKKAFLTLMISTLMAQTAIAQDNTSAVSVQLEDTTITIKSKPKQKGGETILTRQQLNEEQIHTANDLVRYNAEFDVAQLGRYGNKGFAVRGVDGNRVNMNIDGIGLPESEANEIFSPYGYMYEGRFNPEIELMNTIRIQAGADSLISGSGAVGGSVTYHTKKPTDLVKIGNTLGVMSKLLITTKMKNGYTPQDLVIPMTL